MSILRRMRRFALYAVHTPFFICCLLLNFLGLRLRFAHIDSAAFGHFTCDSNLHYLYQIENNYLLIVSIGPVSKVSNKAWFDYLSKEIFNVYPYSWVMVDLSKFWNASLHATDFRRMGSFEPDSLQFFSKNNSIKLKPSLNEESEKFLRSKGWKGQPIIGLVVRDDAWYKKINASDANNQVISDSTRNLVTLEDYYPTIEYLLASGFYVVRIGSAAETSLRDDYPAVLDLPFEYMAPEILHIWLYMNSHLIINSGSGPFHFASFYGVQTLWIGAHTIAYLYSDCMVRYLPAKLFAKVNGCRKQLCLLQQLMIRTTRLKELEKFGVEIEKPSSQLILQSVEQLLREMSNGLKYAPEHVDLMNQYLNVVKYFDLIFHKLDGYNVWKGFSFPSLFSPDFSVCPRFLETCEENYFELDLMVSNEIISLARSGW